MNPLWYSHKKSFNDIKNVINFILVPNLVAFSCSTLNIRVEKCVTKGAIWWDLYNKHISIFLNKHMSNIFRTLQVNKW